MLLWGALAYLAALVPQDLAEHIGRRLRPLGMLAIAGAVITTALVLPIKVAGIGEGWTDALDAKVVGSVLFETSVGSAWQVQAIAALVLLAAFVAPRRIRPGATAGAAGLLLVTLALTGHAVMHEGPLGFAHSINDGVHVLAGGAWLGALIPLFVALQTLDEPAWRNDSSVALRRFSAAGHGAVAVVIGTGALNTMLVLGRAPTNLKTPYQALLLAKIVLVTLMTGLAVLNRYVLVPRMSQARTPTLRALKLATAVEVALGLVVLALVSVFGLLEPA